MIVTDSTSLNLSSPPKWALPVPAPYQPVSSPYQATTPQVYQSTKPIIYTAGPVAHPLTQDHNARRRFFRRAFIAVILLWASIEMLTQSAPGFSYWNSSHRDGLAFWTDILAIPKGVGHRNDCETEWKEAPSGSPFFPLHATATFDVPYDLDAMLFLARGPAGGTFTFVSSDEVLDAARVDVVVSYFREEFRDRAKVCRIKRGESSAGIGIFTPKCDGRHPSKEDRLTFSVVVTVPANSQTKPLEIKNLVVDMPLFGLSAEKLEDSVSFVNITLVSSQMFITAKSLLAENILLKTSNAPISGAFNVSKTLQLITSNAAIQADIGLINEGNISTEAFIKSSNGPIVSSISLLTDKEGSPGGVYGIEATTSNAALRVDFPTAPVDSTLSLDVKTSHGPATVSLHPTYEGQFELSSSLFMPVLDKRTVDDPSGRGRERTIESRSSRGALSGRVQWTGSDKSEGRVQVKSSIAPVVLKL